MGKTCSCFLVLEFRSFSPPMMRHMPATVQPSNEDALPPAARHLSRAARTFPASGSPSPIAITRLPAAATSFAIADSSFPAAVSPFLTAFTAFTAASSPFPVIVTRFPIPDSRDTMAVSPFPITVSAFPIAATCDTMAVSNAYPSAKLAHFQCLSSKSTFSSLLLLPSFSSRSPGLQLFTLLYLR